MLDFGIYLGELAATAVTDGAQVAGTPQYMAPEQACGLRGAIDARSIQFSLAAIAYSLLTGREPFVAEDPIAVLYQVVHADPVPPSALLPRLGPAVDAVIGAEGWPGADRPRASLAVLAFATAHPHAIEGVPVTLYEAADTDEPPPVRARSTPSRRPPPSRAPRRRWHLRGGRRVG